MRTQPIQYHDVNFEGSAFRKIPYVDKSMALSSSWIVVKGETNQGESEKASKLARCNIGLDKQAVKKPAQKKIQNGI